MKHERLTYRPVNTLVNYKNTESYSETLESLLKENSRFDYLEWLISPLEDGEMDKPSNRKLNYNLKGNKAYWEDSLFRTIIPSWIFLNQEINLQEDNPAKYIKEANREFSEKDLVAIFKSISYMKSVYREAIVKQYLDELYLIENFILTLNAIEILNEKLIIDSSFFRSWKDKLYERLEKEPMKKQFIKNRVNEIKNEITETDGNKEYIQKLSEVLNALYLLEDFDLASHRFVFSLIKKEGHSINQVWIQNLFVLNRLLEERPFSFTNVWPLNITMQQHFDFISIKINKKVQSYQQLSRYEDLYKQKRMASNEEFERIIDLFVNDESIFPFVKEKLLASSENQFAVLYLIKHEGVNWDNIFQSEQDVDVLYDFIEISWDQEDFYYEVLTAIRNKISHIKNKREFFHSQIISGKRYKWLAIVDKSFLQSYWGSEGENHFSLLRESLLEDWGSEINDYKYCHYVEFLFMNDNDEMKSEILTNPDYYINYVNREGNHGGLKEWVFEGKVQKKFYQLIKTVLDNEEFKRGAELAKATLQKDHLQKLAMEFLNQFDQTSKVKEQLQFLHDLGFSVIGKEAFINKEDKSMDKDKVAEHAEQYQLDEDVYSVAGAKWNYYLQKPGLLNIETNEVIVRAVVHAEIANEEELDDLFNELGNI